MAKNRRATTGCARRVAESTTGLSTTHAVLSVGRAVAFRPRRPGWRVVGADVQLHQPKGVRDAARQQGRVCAALTHAAGDARDAASTLIALAIASKDP
jgi:hypothetical protein